MAKEHISIQMEISIQDGGNSVKRTDKELTHMLIQV